MTILWRGLSWIGAGVYALVMLVGLWLTSSAIWLAWVAVLAILLTGCMTTNPDRWQATDWDGRKAAIYDCQQAQAAQMQWAAGFGGAIVPLVALFTASRGFDECMDARGYRKVE